MADQFSKATILNKLKEKVSAKGFNLEPAKDDMAKGVPVLLDFLDLLAETISDVFYSDQDKAGTIKANKVKLGPAGLQMPSSYKEASIKYDITTDPKFFAWMETFHSILQGVYPEPGQGAPNVFNTALKVLLSQKPTSLTGKITEGSGTVKVTT